MPAVFVEEEGTANGIEGATFDHDWSESGGGFYDVELSLGVGDSVFTTFADGFNAKQWDYSYGQIVALTRSSNGGGTCF